MASTTISALRRPHTPAPAPRTPRSRGALPGRPGARGHRAGPRKGSGAPPRGVGAGVGPSAVPCGRGGRRRGRAAGAAAAATARRRCTAPHRAACRRGPGRPVTILNSIGSTTIRFGSDDTQLSEAFPNTPRARPAAAAQRAPRRPAAARRPLLTPAHRPLPAPARRRRPPRPPRRPLPHARAEASMDASGACLQALRSFTSRGPFLQRLSGIWGRG
jgi:hypothetical protein